MNKKYLLSIVVPTKDRYYYLKYLIKLIHSFKSEDIELVIQDNTKNNKEFFEYITSLNYDDLYYYHTEEPMSVSENSTRAILNSHGEYVCYIGDDDGVSENIIDQVKYLKQEGLDAMITRLAVYNWPDFKDDSLFKLSGTLTVNFPLKHDKILYSKEELDKVIKSGFANLGLLPRVYQGVVSRSALDKVYNICHTYFPGPSPDMANSVALSSVIDKYLYSDRPIIITGQSKYVGGGERLLTKLVNLTEVPHLPKDTMKYWDKKIPTLWCTDTIWPASATIAASKMGMRLMVNYDKIYGRFLYNHPTYVFVLKNLESNRIKIMLYKIIIFSQKFSNWIKNRIYYYLSGNRKVYNAQIYRKLVTIDQATKVLNSL